MLKIKNKIYNYIDNLFSPCKKSENLKVIITGSPRAGTSFLAGLISQMGFNPGPEDWLKQGDDNNQYGYFECIPLWNISSMILKKLGGDFHELPAYNPNWTTFFNPEKKKIIKLINRGNIEIYKDNQLLILSELYHELFPNAKWIFINREITETYKSRFGEEISFEQWEEITNNRMTRWYSSPSSKKALYLNYQDFKNDIAETINILQCFLGIEITQQQIESCSNFFRPKN